MKVLSTEPSIENWHEKQRGEKKKLNRMGNFVQYTWHAVNNNSFLGLKNVYV